MKLAYFTILLALTAAPLLAQDATDEAQEYPLDDASELDSLDLNMLSEEYAYIAWVDSVNESLRWETGRVFLDDDMAYIDVPAGFKYLNPEQTDFIMSEVYGNPPTESLGSLFPEFMDLMSDSSSYLIEISFEDEGYVEDDDVDDIDYDELLESMQTDIQNEQEYRLQQGYETYALLGWASPPFYDAASKKLHWALELNFGEAESNTLNYNIRVLGRRGFLVLNAIGDMADLPAFQRDVDEILTAVHFNEGHTYADFDPDLDKVAAYGVGGLIAGKVLAKTGILALIAKFGKFIVLGIIGAFAALRGRLFGKKKDENTLPEQTS